MKKVILFCLVVVLALTFTSCSQAQTQSIPSGYIECDEHWDEKGSQDYIDYCKYIYDSDEKVIKSSKYKKVTKEDIENINGYFDDFEKRMESADRLSEYDFDKNCISIGDYIKIKEKGNQYENYSICFFDEETLTLYYIHNNI